MPASLSLTSPAAASLAATLMLVRDRDGLEVLMVERHGDMLFGPGALVFPGGKLDPQDLASAWQGRARGWAELAAEDRGLRLCAIRETFEETGVLLGASVGNKPDQGERLAAFRRKAAADDLLFSQVVDAMDVQPDLGALTPFARWITPESRPIRFDASFYLARAPEGQQAVCDGREAITAEWLAPDMALRLADAGQRRLMRPTRANLALLSESSCVADAVAAARARPLQTVLQAD